MLTQPRSTRPAAPSCAGPDAHGRPDRRQTEPTLAHARPGKIRSGGPVADPEASREAPAPEGAAEADRVPGTLGGGAPRAEARGPWEQPRLAPERSLASEDGGSVLRSRNCPPGLRVRRRTRTIALLETKGTPRIWSAGMAAGQRTRGGWTLRASPGVDEAGERLLAARPDFDAGTGPRLRSWPRDAASAGHGGVPSRRGLKPKTGDGR